MAIDCAEPVRPAAKFLFWTTFRLKRSLACFVSVIVSDFGRPPLFLGGGASGRGDASATSSVMAKPGYVHAETTARVAAGGDVHPRANRGAGRLSPLTCHVDLEGGDDRGELPRMRRWCALQLGDCLYHVALTHSSSQTTTGLARPRTAARCALKLTH